jgi:hypothetical protein
MVVPEQAVVSVKRGSGVDQPGSARSIARVPIDLASAYVQRTAVVYRESTATHACPVHEVVFV